MPIVKKNDIAPERAIVAVIYGVPGSGKTSLGITAENPILIDTDRGYDRAVHRVDTLVAQKWQDILEEMETIKQYKTAVVDTAKACLDDYLSAFVCEKDYRLKTNALKRYGQMGERLRHSSTNCVLPDWILSLSATTKRPRKETLSNTLPTAPARAKICLYALQTR